MPDPRFSAEYRILVDWAGSGTFTMNPLGWEGRGISPPELSIVDGQSPPVDGKVTRVAWIDGTIFLFGVEGHGFDQGRFLGTVTTEAEDVFLFGVEGHGFDQGKFGGDEVYDPELHEPHVVKDITPLSGRMTFLEVHLMVPTGSPHVRFRISGTQIDVTTNEHDTWLTYKFEWFAQGNGGYHLRVDPVSEVDMGQEVFIGPVLMYGLQDDVTHHSLAIRQGLDTAYGRSSTRAYDSVHNAETGLILDNRDRRYSPGNPGSVLTGRVGPGRHVRAIARFGGVEYPLFTGRLSDFQIEPDPENRHVVFTANDRIGYESTTKLTGDVHPAVTTGEALHHLLDALDWPPHLREIDQGASILRWWSLDNRTPVEVVQEAVDAEGLPALAYVAPDGTFIFYSRHHRALRERSVTPQMGLTKEHYSVPFRYATGWKEVYNKFNQEVTEPISSAFNTHLWSQSGDLDIPLGIKTINAEFSEPVISVVQPEVDIDYVVAFGNPEITVHNVQGRRFDITLKAMGNPARITDFKIRGVSVASASALHVHHEDQESIELNGVAEWDRTVPALYNDVEAVSERIIGQRSRVNPAITLEIRNGSTDNLIKALNTKVSDKVHITEEETFTNDDFYVERIEHRVNQAGVEHFTTLHLDTAPEQAENVFIFGDPDRGFDRGVFGYTGIEEPDRIAVVGVSKISEGALAY